MEESFFVKALGASPVIKVLDFLMENRIFDYSKTDIARETGISRATLDSFWNNLLELGIAKETRRIGRATLYTLNKEGEIVKKMVEFDFALSRDYADKITSTGKKKEIAYA